MIFLVKRAHRSNRRRPSGRLGPSGLSGPLGTLAPLALLVLLATFAGCGGCGERPPAAGGDAADALDRPLRATGEPQRGGTLVVAVISDIDQVNDALATSSRTTADVLDQLFLRLIEERPDFTEHPPTFGPELAERYELSDDRRTLTFHLRRDAVWSDGEPITAEDVRFTWQAHVDPDVAWNGAYFKANIEDVEVVDPHTVRFHFSRVTPGQLLEANEGYILPRHVWGQVPFAEWRQRADFFRDHLVVSGPYRLERWTPQQEVVLTRNERYFDPERPYIDRLVFRVVPDRNSQVTQLLSGGVHFVEQVSVPDLPRVRASQGARVDAYAHRLYAYVSWNQRRELFTDRRVRQALTLAIDRQTMVDTLWGPYARVAVSPIVSSVWAHNRDLEPWPYDPDRARKLLAEAGWRDTDGDGVLDRDGRAFRFELLTNQGNQARIDAAVMVQASLAQVGIEARPRVVEFNSLMARVTETDFDALVAGWGMPTNLDLSYAFHTDGDENFGGYSSAEADRLIDEMSAATDLAALGPQLGRLQEVIHRDQPMTFLWESQRTNGVSRRLQDVQSNLLSAFYHLEEWWLVPAP